MTNWLRFASPELLNLGAPPALAFKDFETLYGDTVADFVSRMTVAGFDYNATVVETDPAVMLLQAGAYRDLLRRNEIDLAVERTYLGSASGEFLDQRSADYGVLRRVVKVADTVAGTEEVVEDDDSLRLRARLAWEALSVAGPAGAYVFHALNAHPEVFDAMVYGPESGYVEPGQVLVVIQSRAEDGRPTRAMVDAVAAHLDAGVVSYGSIETVAVNSGGTGYAVGDMIEAVGDGGSGFEAEVFTVAGGVITAIKINNKGIGYIDTPELVVTSEDGEGAELVAGIFVARAVGGNQSLRALTDYVTVRAAQPVYYNTTAALYVDPDGDPEALRLAAIANLEAYQETRKRIGYRVPRSGREAALALVSPNGIPVISDVDVSEDDVVPSYLEVPIPGTNTISAVVR